MFFIQLHSLMSCGSLGARSAVVFIVISFFLVGSHNWAAHGPSLHKHGSTNSLVVTLEISLHLIRPIHVSLGVGVVFSFSWVTCMLVNLLALFVFSLVFYSLCSHFCFCFCFALLFVSFLVLFIG